MSATLLLQHLLDTTNCCKRIMNTQWHACNNFVKVIMSLFTFLFSVTQTFTLQNQFHCSPLNLLNFPLNNWAWELVETIVLCRWKYILQCRFLVQTGAHPGLHNNDTQSKCLHIQEVIADAFLLYLQVMKL